MLEAKRALTRLTQKLEVIVPHRDASSGTVEAALLPKSMLNDDSISLMKVGEIGITVPWAMSVTLEGRCYLSPHFSVEKGSTPGGSLKLIIGRSEAGYEIGVPRGYQYEPRDIQIGTLIPVVKLYEALWAA